MKKLHNPERSMAALAFLLVPINMIAQLIYFYPYINDQVISAYIPTPDAVGYSESAKLVSEGFKFSEAFSGGFRMPGYSMFLSLFYLISDTPLLWARASQILLSGFFPLFAYMTLNKIGCKPFWSLLGAAWVAIWLPFYHYTPVILSETLSIFFMCLVCYLLAQYSRGNRWVPLILCAVCVAFLTYLRPNQIMLFLPCMIFLDYLRKTKPLISRMARPLVFLVVVGALIFPWSVFISMKIGAFVPLGTSAGVNIYLGTGAYVPFDDSAVGTLPDKVAKKYNLVRYDFHREIQAQNISLSDFEFSRLYLSYARQAIMEAPVGSLFYNAAKVLHTFGFSLRGGQDILVLIHLIVSLFASIYLWYSNNFRVWSIFLWAVLGVVMIQSFFLIPSQRLKFTVYDFPSIIIIVLALNVYFGKKSGPVEKMAQA